MKTINVATEAEKIARRLEGYSDAVVDLDDMIAELGIEYKRVERELLKAIDRCVFLCGVCGYWHRQVYNATPDAQEWICKECHRDADK